MYYFCCNDFFRYSKHSTFERVKVDVLQRQNTFITFFDNNRLVWFSSFNFTKLFFERTFNDYYRHEHSRTDSFMNHQVLHLSDCSHCISNEDILFDEDHLVNFFHYTNFDNSKHVFDHVRRVCQVCSLNCCYDDISRHCYFEERLEHRNRVNVHLTHFHRCTSSKVTVVFMKLESNCLHQGILKDPTESSAFFLSSFWVYKHFFPLFQAQ